MNAFMKLFQFRHRLPEVAHAPPDAQWRNVRPRESAKSVAARLADKDGDVESEDVAVVERHIFERTYRLRDDGRFQKRTDVTYRYFQLPHAVTVRTLEGAQRAEPNDWIMEGLNGEIWPVHAEDARKIYEMV